MIPKFKKFFVIFQNLISCYGKINAFAKPLRFNKTSHAPGKFRPLQNGFAFQILPLL